MAFGAFRRLAQETFPEMWHKIVDLLCDSERGRQVDNLIVSSLP